MKKSFVALLVVLLAISSFCFAAGASEDDGVLVIKGIYMNQAGYQMEDIEQMAADYEAAHPGRFGNHCPTSVLCGTLRLYPAMG